MSKEKLQIDLIKDVKRSTEDIVLEEDTIAEVQNKINIPCNGRQWECILTTFIRIQPPLQVDVEPSLEILDSFITHSPKRYIEKVVLDSFRDNIKKKNNYE